VVFKAGQPYRSAPESSTMAATPQKQSKPKTPAAKRGGATL
jgi:hypothetical protein